MYAGSVIRLAVGAWECANYSLAHIAKIVINAIGEWGRGNVRGRGLTQIKPLVSFVVHEVVEDVQRRMGESSRGYVASRLVVEALTDVPTLNTLGAYMWRSYRLGDIEWPGHDERDDIAELLPDAWTRARRLTLRFSANELGRIDEMAFALAISRHNAVAAILRLACVDDRLIAKTFDAYVYRSAHTLRKGVFSRGILRPDRRNT